MIARDIFLTAEYSMSGLFFVAKTWSRITCTLRVRRPLLYWNLLFHISYLSRWLLLLREKVSTVKTGTSWKREKEKCASVKRKGSTNDILEEIRVFSLLYALNPVWNDMVLLRTDNDCPSPKVFNGLPCVLWRRNKLEFLRVFLFLLPLCTHSIGLGQCTFLLQIWRVPKTGAGCCHISSSYSVLRNGKHGIWCNLDKVSSRKCIPSFPTSGQGEVH